jgi:outer membrane lipoprotein-sorting protein
MMKRTTLVIAVCALLFVGISGCKQAKNEAVAPAPQAQAQPPVQLGQNISGKVVETMNSGGYTYVSIEKDGKSTWVAMPETKVRVGQEVTCAGGMEMQNFKSKTLNRTFASIIFSEGLR